MVSLSGEGHPSSVEVPLLALALHGTTSLCTFSPRCSLWGGRRFSRSPELFFRSQQDNSSRRVLSPVSVSQLLSEIPSNLVPSQFQCYSCRQCLSCSNNPGPKGEIRKAVFSALLLITALDRVIISVSTSRINLPTMYWTWQHLLYRLFFSHAPSDTNKVPL